MQKNINVAFTGASGLQFGIKLVQFLLNNNYLVHLMVSEAAKMVAKLEMGINFTNTNSIKQYFLHPRLSVINLKDWTCPLASGSGFKGPLIICPCSMKTLSAIATGYSDNIISRSADVALKEGHDVIIVPRETPLNQIHLENLLKLCQMGAKIVPPIVGFYTKPQSIDDIIDFVVGKVLSAAKISHNLIPQWGKKETNL